MPQHDPLAVIATRTPTFSDREAISIVRERYGLDVVVRTLVSERDQNFRLQTADGQRYVLKIANAQEDPAVTLFQIRALVHLQEHRRQGDLVLNVPQVVRTRDGNTHITLDSSAGSHIARVVSFVDGIPLGERVPAAALCTNMGRYLASLGLALKDFDDPGSSQVLLWDMQQAPAVRKLLPHIPCDAHRQLVDRTLQEFEKYALPAFETIRSQIIHSDFNPDNVLVRADDDNDVAGVIDFGDMLHSPLIVDVAIGACYLRPSSGNPLALIAEFLAAYHTITPLTRDELGVLFTLIKTRLAVSMAILYWRISSREKSDPYLAKLLTAESPAENFLRRLNELPRDNATQVFTQICASAGRARSQPAGQDLS